jgi:hypothetical protein
MTHFGFIRSFLCLVIETELKGIVPVYRFGSDLGDDTWTCLDNGTGNILPVLVKDAGHADFFSD